MERHSPDPAAVVQVGDVQHLMSLEPGHKLAVCVPPGQHPAEMDTHTPAMPPAVQVAEYGHVEVRFPSGMSGASALWKARPCEKATDSVKRELQI